MDVFQLRIPFYRWTHIVSGVLPPHSDVAASPHGDASLCTVDWISPGQIPERQGSKGRKILT